MKQHTVWYKSGSGGMFVSWLLQICVDPTHLTDALIAFPKKLQHTTEQWKDYEQVPPNIGILCNVLHSTSPYYANDFKHQTQDTIDKLKTGGDNFYDLLHCRIKYYLVNCVFNSGFVSSNVFDSVKSSVNSPIFQDTGYIKKQTDIIFDMSKNIFVVAPESFCRAAAISKNIAFQLSDINSVLVDPANNLNTFNLESVWVGTWQHELEKVLDTKLSSPQITACKTFVSHYLDLNATILKDVIDAG